MLEDTDDSSQLSWDIKMLSLCHVEDGSGRVVHSYRMKEKVRKQPQQQSSTTAQETRHLPLLLLLLGIWPSHGRRWQTTISEARYSFVPTWLLVICLETGCSEDLSVVTIAICISQSICDIVSHFKSHKSVSENAGKEQGQQAGIKLKE